MHFWLVLSFEPRNMVMNQSGAELVNNMYVFLNLIDPHKEHYE